VAAPEPLYVLATDARTNRVTVGERAELATREVAVRGARMHRPGEEVDAVKLRYRSRPLPCTVAEQGRGRLTVHLSEPADGGAAPGQTACLYAGDVVVGYGTIAG
jgi:tRNA-specific 2-thiouridylase